MGLLGFLFPIRCIGCKKVGEYLCSVCFTQVSFDSFSVCVICGKGSIDGLTHPYCSTSFGINGAFCGVVYRGIIKKIVYQFKYQPYLSSLSDFIAKLLYESLIQQESFMHVCQNQQLIFVPIPLSHKKLQKRGYNQSLLLARSLVKLLGGEIREYLIRQKDTKPQYGLKKEERRENIRDAFAIQKDHGVLGTMETVFLVDDILTTGATLYEAAKVLKKAGFKRVYGICLARDQ